MTSTSDTHHAQQVSPGAFNVERHFYERVQNAQLHPVVSFFFTLSTERILERYLHLNPHVDRESLQDVLWYKPKYLPWAGADLFHVTSARGRKKMVVIETNSCPSGQKSTPAYLEHEERGGYLRLMQETFAPALKGKRLPRGGLAMVYDKNPMEATGYAAAMADHFQEPVWLAYFAQEDPNPPVKFEAGVMHIRDEEGAWHPIRAAMRYVTQRPWNRIPVHTQTYILNPTLGCLAGGRNKMVADKAYAWLNSELANSGLQINVPETKRDVGKAAVPLAVKEFGGYAVVKIPYSNAGQGVFTITNEQELEDFMARDYPYDQFIVQSLIGNAEWSSQFGGERFYHVGTMPNKKMQTYVADLRMMLSSTPQGFRPLAMYARKAHAPLTPVLDETTNSRDQLVTNLSIKTPDGWDSDTSRLLLMDRKDFNQLGVSLDDLISGFVQTCLSVVAIDKLARYLINSKGRFREKTFRSINNDEALLREIKITS